MTIYCGRNRKGLVTQAPGVEGWLGNPAPSTGKVACPFCGVKHGKPRGSTLACYKRYLWVRLKTDQKFNELFYQLRGKEDLFDCFCIRKGYPETCHTSIMRSALSNPNVVVDGVVPPGLENYKLF